MATRHSMFLRLWMNDAVRDVLCDGCDDETLCSLRLVSRDLADAISPILFKTLFVSFRLDSFSKPGRLDTFSKIGRYVRDLHFSMEHGEATFLPDLYEPDGESSMWPWNPTRTVKAKVDRNIRRPTESEEWMEQWPPMFQAASNAYQFIRFFEHMPRLRGLTLTTCGQDSRDLYRRSAVDFAVASIRIALDTVDLHNFRRLSLDVHPGAILSLMPSQSFVNTPRSTRLVTRIKKLKITVASWKFEDQERDYLKILDKYVRGFCPTLEKLIFTWDGERGPCPLTLQSDPLINPAAAQPKEESDHLLFGEVTTPNSPLPETPAKPEMLFKRLRSIKLQNVTLTSQQLHDFFGRHRDCLRSYEFNGIELSDRGSFEYAVAPLLNLEDKTSRWPATVGNCNQSFTDSGYESPGSNIGGASPIDGPAGNLWAGITDENIYDDATPGLEFRPKSSKQETTPEPLEPVIITAKHEKRRVKKRRRMHPKELAAKASRQPLESTKAEIPSRLVFGASMLSLKSPSMFGPPLLSHDSLHPHASTESAPQPLYGAVGDICLASMQEPNTPHPALRADFSLVDWDEPATPRALASMKSAPVLLQPTVFAPLRKPVANSDVSSTPRPVSETPILLKPSVFDPSAAYTRTPRTPTFSYPPAAPRPTNLCTPCSSIYSPLFGDQTPRAACFFDTPTPPPLNIHRPGHPPPPSVMSISPPPAAENVRPATRFPPYKSPTASTMMATMIPPLLSPYIISQPPQTPPTQSEPAFTSSSPIISRPRNPLLAAAHLSLIADPVRCDTEIAARKETLIASFATKYSELNSQPSQATISTLSSFSPPEPGEKGTLGRSISTRLLQLGNSISGTAAVQPPAQPANINIAVSEGFVGKAGQALKKGFLRAFTTAQRRPTLEAEASSTPALLAHHRSKSDPSHGGSGSNNSSSQEHNNEPRRRRRHHHHHRRQQTHPSSQQDTASPDPFPQASPSRSARSPDTPAPTARPNTSHSSRAATSPSTTAAGAEAKATPARSGHGIDAAYAQLMTRRSGAEEKVRLAEALEAECRVALSGVDGVRVVSGCESTGGAGVHAGHDDLMIDMRAAWAPELADGGAGTGPDGYEDCYGDVVYGKHASSGVMYELREEDEREEDLHGSQTAGWGSTAGRTLRY